VSARTLPARGTLKEHSVTRLLQIVLDEQISGALIVTRGDTTRTLYVKNGMITYATSTENRDRLGEIFIIQGKLSEEEVREAFRKARSKNTLLGRVLLVDGLITSQELFLAVTAQVVAILERMRSWRKGDFIFEFGGEPEAGTVLLRIPLSLYLGVKEKKRKVAPPLPRGREEVRTAEAEKRYGEEIPEGFEFTDEEETEATLLAVEAEKTPEGGNEEPPDIVQDEAGTWGEVEISDDGETVRQAGAEDAVAGDINVGSLVEEIAFNVQEIRRRSGRGAHTLLGVGEDATVAEVQDAYHYLAKILHPDHHPPELPEDISRDTADLFQEVTAAYHEAERSAGAAPSTAAGTAPAAASQERVSASEDSLVAGDQTRRLFYRAKEQMAKGNYWQATDSLRQVVRRRPREAMYRNLLGFCLMQTGRRLHEAEEHIREAIRLDPGNPDFITNLGLVYKAGRFHSKAKDMFQQALIYDKRHKMARQQLKEVAPLADPGAAKPIWKKFFGK
jgi:Flp pilus assembly protein TadD